MSVKEKEEEFEIPSGWLKPYVSVGLLSAPDDLSWFDKCREKLEWNVQAVIESVFNKAPAEAYRIMMAVHTQGQGLCGVYPHEVAETKVATVVDMARSHGFPLRAAMEPE